MYYSLLDLKKEDNPTKEIIKIAYKKKALKIHPDKINSLPENELNELSNFYSVSINDLKDGTYFKKVVEAYTILSNQENLQNTQNNIFSTLINIFIDKINPEYKSTAHKITDDLYNLMYKIYLSKYNKENASIYKTININYDDIGKTKEVKINRKKAKIIDNKIIYYYEDEIFHINILNYDEIIEYPAGGHIIEQIDNSNIKDYIRNKDNYGNLIIDLNLSLKIWIYNPNIIYTTEYINELENNSPYLYNNSIIFFKKITLYQALTGVNTIINTFEPMFHNNILYNNTIKIKDNIYIKYLIDYSNYTLENMEYIEKLN